MEPKLPLELSYSSVSTYQTCPRKFFHRYISGLEPVTKATALIIGTITHEARDLHFRGASQANVTEHISNRYNEEILKVEVADQEELVLARYSTLGMWLNYPYKDLKEFEEVHTEEEFKVPLSNSTNVVVTGRIDGRVKKAGKWWIHELKTTNLSQQQFESRASTSAQVTGYVYGLKKKGCDVVGIIYDCIRKPLLRKGQYEDMHVFGRRIMKDYKDRPKFYYSQYSTYRSTQDLDIYETDMLAVAEDILEKIYSGKGFYRNQEACWNYNSECPYKKICFNEQPDPLTVQLYFVTGGVSIRIERR